MVLEYYHFKAVNLILLSRTFDNEHFKSNDTQLSRRILIKDKYIIELHAKILNRSTAVASATTIRASNHKMFSDTTNELSQALYIYDIRTA